MGQRSWHHTVFVSYVAAMLLAFLLPVRITPPAEAKHADKLVHFGLFVGFALLLWLDKRPKGWSILLISAAFAAAIELVQWRVPVLGRQGDWMDWAAGVSGAAFGTILLLTWESRRPFPSK
jgi:VanZ family protein